MATCGMRRIKLGSQGLEVSAQGFGCAHYGPSKPETDDIALLHHAIISGVTFLDTSDAYGPHTNELLLAKVLISIIFEKLLEMFGVCVFSFGRIPNNKNLALILFMNFIFLVCRDDDYIVEFV